MITAFHARGNQLLAALPDEELARRLPNLECVEVPLGAVLYESGGRLSHAYFPRRRRVSLLCVLIDGGSAELAVVGREGLVGVPLLWVGKQRQAAPWCKAPVSWCA